MLKKQGMATQKSTVPPVKVLGSFSAEVCLKMARTTEPGLATGYSYTPKTPLLLMGVEHFPGKLAPQLTKLARLEEYAVTAVLAPKAGEASWPSGVLKQIKIKLRDRFRRHLLCLIVDASRLEIGTTQLFRDVSPGVSLVLQTAKSPAAIARMQVAIHKSHLRADVWKYHFSAYYAPVPRPQQRADGVLAAAACMRAGCGKVSEEMRMCPCGEAMYCSDEHAAEAWYAGHSESCKAAAAESE